MVTVRCDHVKHFVSAAELRRNELQERDAPIAMQRHAQYAMRRLVRERAKAAARSPRVRLWRVHLGHEGDAVLSDKLFERLVVDA